MPKITEIYAYIVDEGDGDEGIPAVFIDAGWMPLIGADMDRVRSLKSHVDLVALAGKPMTLKKYVLVDD